MNRKQQRKAIDDALDDFYSDTSVSSEQTKSDLEEIIANIKTMIDALENDD